MIDTVGFFIIFSFVGEINWGIKILAITLLLATVSDLKEVILDLRLMGDEQKFRERLLCKLEQNNNWFTIPWLGRWVRLASSITLFVVIYLWKNQL